MPALHHRKPFPMRRATGHATANCMAAGVLPRTSVWTTTGKPDSLGTAALGRKNESESLNGIKRAWSDRKKATDAMGFTRKWGNRNGLR